ncbi:uncharacterized protein LOC109609427 [Aethina tumida]|uniref:uncharacterized protein LOC109609427 n=1 Tax=Aethina tumida TaxID=116153 RepID=UPI00096B4AA5|nr:uncharacterized protein LOC109609427 [Aethina tumida]
MPSLSSPTQSMDTIYPEPMSRLHRRVIPKKRKGDTNRYRTQPVTFSEIQEVDEDNVDESPPATSSSKPELNLLNKKFEEFKRTRDLMLSKIDSENTTDINKNPLPLTTSRSIGRLPSRPSF